jgi:hypothetical protein
VRPRIEFIVIAAIQLPVHREQLDHGDTFDSPQQPRDTRLFPTPSKFIGPMRQLTTTFSRLREEENPT